MDLFVDKDDRVVSERRKFERMPSSGTARLDWLDSSSRHHSTAVRVRNITTEGMMLEMPYSVEPQLARITGLEWQCIGWLRYCEPENSKFIAGFQFAQKPYEREASDSDHTHGSRE